MTGPMVDLVARWNAARAELRAAEAAEHPDLTDKFGRVWVWESGDLYQHDGLMTWPREAIERPSIGLPQPGLAERNPNYAGLCAICRHEKG